MANIQTQSTSSSLLTPELKKRFENYPLHSQDGKGKDAICLAVLHVNACRWYILEGEPEGDTFMFYVISCGGSLIPEYGYLSLSSVEEANAQRVHQISFLPEFVPTPLKEIHDDVLQDFLS